ncbi:MAG: hypothetical protein OHK93_003790 [Ramalina farinacea]|uniref:LysM domain-containing protein n=1 Tax=Ramalina farinacea TaxID=258253 RepID=A0AA43QTX1_9LECA|nr:hypothetical protein [Ramalina farinacea]
MPFMTRLVGALHFFTLLLICRTAPIANNTIPATYKVVSGDSLSAISTRFNSTLQALEACNPQVTNPDLIQPGQLLSLPQPSPSSQTTNSSSSSSKQTYTVIGGDTLSAIASKNNIPLDKLEAANPQITNPASIVPGQVINLSSSSSSSSSGASSAPGKYTVVQGDNLTSIAGKLNTTLAALEAANPSIKDFNSIVPGQVLNTPAAAGVTAAQAAGSCGKLP